MRDTFYIFTTMIFVWTSVAIVSPTTTEQNLSTAQIIVASVAAVYAGLFVLLGESIIEDIVKSVIMLILASVLALNMLEMKFVLYAALISSLAGIFFNAMNKKAADNALKKNSSAPDN